MAKGKPNLAFLEALKQDKRRRGDQAPGGVFKTPAWFNKTAVTPQQSAAAKGPAGAAPAALSLAPAAADHKAFRLTYTHIAVGGVAMLVVASATFMALRKPAAPQNSVSIEAIRSAPAQGNVMDVPAGRTAVTPPIPAAVPLANAVTPPAANAAQQQAPALAGASVSPAGARSAGMNYVVFQSYKDEKTATEAKDALIAGGVGATVEKGHPYAPTWYVVIGTQGFVKPGTTDYLQYISKSRAISEKFAGRNKWKQFEPNPYKWR